MYELNVYYTDGGYSHLQSMNAAEITDLAATLAARSDVFAVVAPRFYTPRHNECEWCAADISKWDTNALGYATCPECGQIGG